MSFLSNAHTHSTYCDGRSTIAQTVAEARRLGFVSIGFSGHAAQGFDTDYSMTDEAQRAYFAELRALQAQGGAPRIWAGLELDYRADPKRRQAAQQADYIIGSTHYLTLDFHGECVAVDGDTSTLERYLKERCSGDGLRMAREYFDIHVRDTLEYRPQIIGHFDLIRKNAARLKLFDENGTAYRRLALDALERIYPCGAVLELNTGGLARGYMTEPYPTPELLNAWRELGGAVTLTSDCHDATKLDFGFDECMAALKRAGYKSVARLGTGDALWEMVGV